VIDVGFTGGGHRRKIELELAPALSAAVPVVEGAHVGRDRRLYPGQEVALLTPVAGG
jgi:molybdopterin converting factor small subunit